MFASFRLRELSAVVVICGLGAAALAPMVARSRESARKRQCVDNLRSVGVALRLYHDARATLPPAAIWEADATGALMLIEVKRIDRFTHENWAQLLLPYLGQSDVAALFDRRQGVMARRNEDGRIIQLAEFSCPTDRFNTPDNLYGFQPRNDEPPLAQFARGNYAINGGTHGIKFVPESTTQPRAERMKIVLDHQQRLFQAIGTGIAGINHSFRLSDFANGQSTLVAVDEIRAGVHPLDLRGVWALGQIGSSITWAHGLVGDDSGPNNQWDRADDILDCGRLHKAVGSDRLEELGMPCCWYLNRSQEATARSQHSGGVHVLFLDGAARFVRDDVDRGLWHVMHSRETPDDVLAGLDENTWAGLPRPSTESQRIQEDGRSARPTAESQRMETRVTKETFPARLREPPAGATITNSIGMEFAEIPAGMFTMGIPDDGNSQPAPAECPPHQVRIRRAFGLGRQEVTQGQFQTVMGRNPSRHLAGAESAESADDFPVENVTWYDAEEFCQRLSERPEEAAQHRRYRLPSEAEWEYACRSGKSEPYRWNPRRLPNDKSGDAAGIEPPLPLCRVGSYPANEFGLNDMRGNVWEWCGDWFDRTYYNRSPVDDPPGPDGGYLKVVRGGDWIFVGEPCRINYPIMSPWQRSPFVGFRVVCQIEP